MLISNAVKVRFGQFEADLEARELRKAGIRVKIHEQPFQVLEALLERPGELVTRDELQHRIWPGDTFVDFDQSLNKAVNRVRAALGDNATNPRFVETLSRRGYRLLVPVERDERTAPAQAPLAPQRLRTRRLWPRWIAVGAGAIAIVAALTLRPMKRETPIRSIVVLPLTNLSGDASQEFFVDGITEAITTELAGIPGLRVVSTTSAMQYKAAKKPLPVIARDLNVEGAIEGSLFRTSNRMRLLLKLIDARSERPLWTNTYVVEIADVLRLQDEVVRLLASEIDLKLNPERQRQPVKPRRIDPAALDAYLKAYSLAQRRTERALKESIDYYQQAISIDPSYARAYAGLGIAYQLQHTYRLVPASDRKQIAAATKALELDSSLAEAHMVLGAAKLHADWDWIAAEKHYKRAVHLSPSYAVNHQWYALGLKWMGRFEEALAEIRVAQEIDPLSVMYRINEGEIYYNRRDYDRAIQHYRRAIERDPTFFHSYALLGLAYVAKGMYNEGVRVLEEAVSRGGGFGTRSWLGYALAKAGKVEDAIRIVEELKSRSGEYPSTYEVAVIYAALGDKDRAFEWLTKAYEERTRQMVFLGVTPLVDGLRSDPRFAALVKKVGLVK